MNVPKLRFPEFEGEWEEKRLDNFGSFKSGVGFPEIEQGGKEGIPFFKVSDMNLAGNEDALTRANHYVTDEQVQRLKYKPIKKKSVVFAKVGAAVFLERKRIAQDFLIDNNMMAFTPNSKVSIDYSAVLFRNTRLSKFAQVGALPSYNGGDLASIKVVVPSLPEQKKIAAFLGVVDAKIAALRDRVAGLERYKRGLMQALFSQTLRFTRSDGTAFPNWEEKRLGEVFDWIKTNSLSRENLNYEVGDTQNIHYGDIHTKFSATFRQSHERVPFVSTGAVPKGFTADEYCQLGDVVIADASEDYADIGKAIEIVELTETPLVAGLHTYIARPKKGLALGFSGYLLRSAKMRLQIMRIAQGISVLGVSKTNLEKLALQLPHPDEQAKIAEALSAMDAKIAAVTGQLEKMQDFKKGLLQQMFV